MSELFNEKFFKFLFGFLLIIIVTLLLIAGVQALKSNSTPNSPPSTATTTG